MQQRRRVERRAEEVRPPEAQGVRKNARSDADRAHPGRRVARSRQRRPEDGAPQLRHRAPARRFPRDGALRNVGALVAARHAMHHRPLGEDVAHLAQQVGRTVAGRRLARGRRAVRRTRPPPDASSSSSA